MDMIATPMRRESRNSYRVSRRGHVPGLIPHDEFGRPMMHHLDDLPFEQRRPPEVFTFRDKTEKRFTYAQAYEHAGSIIKARNNLGPSAIVFNSYSYDVQDERLMLTMVEFSDLVQSLIYHR